MYAINTNNTKIENYVPHSNNVMLRVLTSNYDIGRLRKTYVEFIRYILYYAYQPPRIYYAANNFQIMTFPFKHHVHMAIGPYLFEIPTDKVTRCFRVLI